MFGSFSTCRGKPAKGNWSARFFICANGSLKTVLINDSWHSLGSTVSDLVVAAAAVAVVVVVVFQTAAATAAAAATATAT